MCGPEEKEKKCDDHEIVEFTSEGTERYTSDAELSYVYKPYGALKLAEEAASICVVKWRDSPKFEIEWGPWQIEWKIVSAVAQLEPFDGTEPKWKFKFLKGELVVVWKGTNVRRRQSECYICHA